MVSYQTMREAYRASCTTALFIERVSALDEAGQRRRKNGILEKLDRRQTDPVCIRNFSAKLLSVAHTGAHYNNTDANPVGTRTRPFFRFTPMT